MRRARVGGRSARPARAAARRFPTPSPRPCMRRAPASPHTSSGCAHTTSCGAALSSMSRARAAPPTVNGIRCTPTTSAASPRAPAKGVSQRLERHAVRPVPLSCPPVQVAALPRIRQLRPQQLGHQTMQLIPASCPADRLHEQIGRFELGEPSSAVVATGDGVGEVGTRGRARRSCRAGPGPVARPGPALRRTDIRPRCDRCRRRRPRRRCRPGSRPGPGQLGGERPPTLGAVHQLRQEPRRELGSHGGQHGPGFLRAEGELIGTHLAESPASRSLSRGHGRSSGSRPPR